MRYLILAVLVVFGTDSLAAELSWARRWGGGGSDLPYAVAVDVAGATVTAGTFTGTVDFDPGPGVVQLAPAGGTSGTFVSKLDANGDLVWARSLGGPAAPSALDLTTDATGAVYLSGSFNATADFDPGPGTASLTAINFSTDAFVLKLDADGNFVWVRGWGGNSTDTAQAVGIADDGSVYVGGIFLGTVDFDPGPGTATEVSAGSTDAYVSKLDAAGDFVWVRRFGSSFVDRTIDLAVAAGGDPVLLGDFQGAVDFDPGPGTDTLISAGDFDVFVTRLDATGSLVWARGVGGFSTDLAQGLALGTGDTPHLVGYFGATADFDPGPGTANRTSNGSADAFVCKLDVAGDFLWARAIGGSGFDFAADVAVAADGRVFSGGTFEGTVDFDPGAGVRSVTALGNFPDAFVSELDVGGLFVDAYIFSGSGTDDVINVALDATDNLSATGRFTGATDFDPGPGFVQLVSAGASDVFVVRLGASGGPVPDLFEVELETNGAREVGVPGTVYTFGAFVLADVNLVDATLTPPGRTAIPLTFDPVEGAFVLQSAFYSSLAALRADFPTGEYLLEMNGGSFSVQLDYPELEPQCFAEMTYPMASCTLSSTPTLSWELPVGCAATAVDAGLDLETDETPLFELSFIPGASGSITLPDGPVVPTPLEPLPPLSPLTAGERYVFGVDVVEGTSFVETVGPDSFDYGTWFRHDQDVRFEVGADGAVLRLELDASGLSWGGCAAPASTFDIVRGNLLSLDAGLTASTAACEADDHPTTTIAVADPGPGEAHWYLVRESAGSYTSGGIGEQPGRDAAIAAASNACP